MFVDAENTQVRRARALGVDAVEINTGPYAGANSDVKQQALDRVKAAARLAERQHLEVLAGHGLTYVNVGPIAAIQEIVEVNIGHSLIARAVLVGMERAVREMRGLLNPL